MAGECPVSLPHAECALSGSAGLESSGRSDRVCTACCAFTRNRGLLRAHGYPGLSEAATQSLLVNFLCKWCCELCAGSGLQRQGVRATEADLDNSFCIGYSNVQHRVKAPPSASLGFCCGNASGFLSKTGASANA